MKYLLRNILLVMALFACATFSLAQKNRPSVAATPPPSPVPSEREASAANWVEFSTATGRFSILFPDKPMERTESMGAVDTHIVTLQTFAEYSVMYADYPDPIENASAAHDILDSGVKSAVAADSQILETKEISLDGSPGKYLKERLPDGKILRAKMLLVGQRLFEIAITTPAEQGEPSERVRFYDSVASKYLDSFKLIASQK